MFPWWNGGGHRHKFVQLAGCSPDAETQEKRQSQQQVGRVPESLLHHTVLQWSTSSHDQGQSKFYRDRT